MILTIFGIKMNMAHPSPRPKKDTLGSVAALAALALAKTGDFSYSLYLAHWPVFAFVNNMYFDEPPAGVNAFAVGIGQCE